MLRGDLESAWRISDAVLAARRRRAEDCSRRPRHFQHVWNGDPFDDKHVLVRCYHGLGDTLQFVRLLEPLRERAREVTLWVQPALLELVRSVRGVDRALALHDGAPDVEFDMDIELMELPHALRLSLATVPKRVPYLSVPAPQPFRPECAALRGSRLNVGLAWRSGDWNTERSIPGNLLSLLAGAQGVKFYSLQFPPAETPLALEPLACKDLATMAQRMLALDLVISVDTMVAHLAGALGLTTWTLLHDAADWRWMTHRCDSPWYPTMRLFRRDERGWEGVLVDVRRALESAYGAERTPLHIPAARSADGVPPAIAAPGTRSACCTRSSG